MRAEPFRIQQILFPIDFSKASEAAAPHVAGLAQAVGAKVSLMNVVPWLSGWHGASEPHFVVGDDVLRRLELSQKEAEASSLKELENFAMQFFQGIEYDVSVKTGGVAESIIAHAQEVQADLVMMSTRGFGPPRPFLIGSVTAKVLHDARCAVWTSPHPKELEPFRAYRRIVCAIDYRHPSRELLSHAMEVAQLFKSRLSVVSAVPCPALGEVPCRDRQSVQSLKRETIDALRHLFEELKITPSIHVAEGAIGEVIRQAASMEDGDLVVIGRGHLEESWGHLRTHAYEIIWNSPCPVLSL